MTNFQVACRLLLVLAASSVNSWPLALRQSGSTPLGPPQALAAISGVVIDGASGRPIAGVIVTLSDRAAVAPRPIPREITDAKGRFVFTQLPPSDAYVVVATMPGYLDGRFGSPGPAMEGRGKFINVAAGQWFADGRIQMWKVGAISGRVVDETGDPVAGAWVRVLRQVDVAGAKRLALGEATKTDDRGAYRISNLRAGEYFVQVPSVQMSVPASPYDAGADVLPPTIRRTVEKVAQSVQAANSVAVPSSSSALLIANNYPQPSSSAGRLEVYPSTFYPGARGLSAASGIVLADGEQRAGADVILRAVPTVCVSGRVIAPPEALLDLTLRLITKETEMVWQGDEVATALVSRTGEFTFVGVPAGSYSLEGRRSVAFYTVSGALTGGSAVPQPPGQTFVNGFISVPSASASIRMAYGASPLGDGYWLKQQLEIGSDEVRNLEVSLKQTLALSGRIVYEGQPPDERILPTSPLILEPASGDTSLGLPLGQIRRTPLGDEFRFTGLFPGQYILNSTHVLGQMKSLTRNGKDFSFQPFELDNSDLQDVTITIGTKPAILAGKVTDEQGRPAANVAVIYFPRDPNAWSSYGLQPARIASVVVDTRAGYQVRPPAGDYYVVAVPLAQADGWKDPLFLKVAATLASRVTLVWGEQFTANLTVRSVR